MTSGRLAHIPNVATHLVDSKRAKQTYQIQVMQPVMRRGVTERFPVLYMTDGNLDFDFAKSISCRLQIAGQVRRFILVGIGYPGANPLAGVVLRRRDLTSPHRLRHPDIEDIPKIEGVSEPEEGDPHRASDFLAFISDELIALIDAQYPTLPGERAYAGHSLGGGLGLHALFSQRGLFNRYLLGSPSITYDGDDYGIREAREFIASGRRLDAKVVMSVGELEEFDAAPPVAKAHFVRSFYQLATLLTEAEIPGLELQCRVYPGETHVSVWPLAFSHGVQAIYGAAEHSPVAS